MEKNMFFYAKYIIKNLNEDIMQLIDEKTNI